MFLKCLLPWGQFQFACALTRGDIVTRLTAITGPAYQIMGPDDISGIKWLFVGNVGDQTFRIITPEEHFSLFSFSRSRNMFRPVLSGRFADRTGETLLTVCVRMQIITYVFYGCMLVIGLGAMWFQRSPTMLIFPAAFIVYAHNFFWSMVVRARRSLTQALAISS